MISPILANIYLDKLDKYVKEFADKFNIGNEKKVNPEWVRLKGKRERLVKKIVKLKDESVKRKIITELKEVNNMRMNIPYGDDMDAG